MCSLLFLALFTNAHADDVHWWLVRDKVALGVTLRQPVPSPEDTCEQLSAVDTRACQALTRRTNEHIQENPSIQSALQGKGVVFSLSGLMLIGGIHPGYGHILINAEHIALSAE
ncbi:MAG: hypothetical protein AAFV53_19330 [Myxococcota bacterium]